MPRTLSIAAALLSLAAAPPAAPPAALDAGVTRIAAAPARDGWFVCDAIAGPYALFAGLPDTGGTSVMTLLDRRSGRFDTQNYQVGAPDPGAGQIHWSLSRNGSAAGAVHGVNPGMIEGGAGVTPIAGVEIAGKRLECRLLARTRFIGLDSRRSVVVTEGPQGLVYQSFDFRRRGAATHPDGVQRSNPATLSVGGGAEIGPDPAGFRFANGGYVYTVRWPAAAGAATVTVTRGGRPLGVDRLVGFAVAPAPASKVAAPVLGADTVWAARDLDACRADKAAEADACLIATMRRTGASPAAIAFTQRLVARNAAGYIAAWKQAGPIGIATIAYPFRGGGNGGNAGTMLIPAAGDPIDADDYALTADDKARADYRAAQAQHPQAFAVPPGEIAVKPGADGGTRILVTTATADCRACAPNGSIVVGYDFDAAGHFLRAALVMAA